MAAIVLDNLVKKFADHAVVDHISLSVADGEFFTLLGPSGCGKTTLLRMLAGFTAPDGGDIRFGDKSIVKTPPHRRECGMVFQNYALFPHLTVFDNVAYGLKARKEPAPAIKTRVEDILRSVHLDGFAERYPRQLSGGQQQRVALARALVIRPEVLLMDEPLSNLDAKLRVDMREEIRRIQKGFGITTIYVTHDQEEAMAVSDRIAILSGGRLQQVGRPRDIYFQPANTFTAEFMGACALLRAEADLDQENAVRIAEMPLFLDIGPTPPPPFTLMLRPDWIEEAKDGVSQNRFRAVVQEAIFSGADVIYAVEALGCVMRVRFSAAKCDRLREEGESLDLCFAPRRPVVIRE
ncbi:MAG: ABC transporter ATP-binding protein [Desulfovibrio sp.]|jgi:iron(III) transport system ATP-binding protein|nr:ABC transporter ATP-binding protein [Desulfovibrio sp.]